MKKKFIITILLFGTYISTFAMNELENIEFSSPTLEAAEYTYALENDLQKVLVFLDETEKKIDTSDESKERKTIRKYHLNVLRAFAYRAHESELSKKERGTEIQKIMSKNIEVHEDLINKHSDYSGIYWMTSLTFYIYGTTDFKGMRFLLKHQKESLAYLQKAFELNPNSPTTRIAYANFDSNAPGFVGADKERGKQTIFEEVDDADWPKIWKFEYNISRLLSAIKNEDEALKKETIATLESLYPGSWRIKKVLDNA